MVEHSPTPWRFEKRPDGDEVIFDAAGKSVHWDTQYYPSGLASEDAEFIVASVNRVGALEAALREIADLGDVDCDTAPNIAKRALQK